MTINEILGFEDYFFYENLGFICVYSVLLFIIYLGLKFLKDGRKAEKGTPISYLSSVSQSGKVYIF
ncbi:MAG: hypothetical protein ACTSQS_19075 [Promethearchaeota archaeon]